MLSVAEARAIMLEAVRELPTETIALDRAYGRILAAPLIATRDQPPFDSSAMDGYAFASAPGLRDLQIVGESAAGHAFTGQLSADEAVRISTGAPLPASADGVLIQEEANLADGRLLGAQVERGRHVRPRAGDFARGAVLLEKGRRLDPIAVALAASAGTPRLRVVQTPRVAIIAGGDEILQPGQEAAADQVYESGSFAICGLIEAWGGDATRHPALPDQPEAIAAAAEAAMRGADLLVLIGGASVGPHDHARPALQRVGVEIRVEKISVRPGKPTWFGVAPSGLVLGLPGNPASAIVCAMLFLRPLLHRMLGRDADSTRTRTAVLTTPLPANGPREAYLRASVDAEGRAHAFDDQDSSLLSIFAKANALIQRPANAPPLASGEKAPYIAL